MFKPTLWNLWDYIVDEGCLRTDCGTEEYLIKWNWQHRVPAKLDEISSWTTKYWITIPEERKDKEVTLIEDLPFDEKSLFMYDEYSDWPYIELVSDLSDPILVFSIQKEDQQQGIDYEFPILWHKTIVKPFYSSLNKPESAQRQNLEYLDTKIIIDFFWKPVLLTYQKVYWDEEKQEDVFRLFLDSEWNKLKAKFSNFSFDDTTEKWFESLHFDIDWIRFNMNPHFPYLPDWFKFDDENMEQNPWIDYDEVLKTAHDYVMNILENNNNYYSMIWNRYKTWPWLDNTARWLQWANIYWWKIIDVYDKALNEKLVVDIEDPDSQALLIENFFSLIYTEKTTIDQHTYCTATFTVWDKNIEPQPMKWLAVTINDESNYQSVPTIEWDAELTLIDNVLSSLTNEQKYSLFLIFERLSFNRDLQNLVLPRETLESEESFRRFIVSLLSDNWDIINKR